MPPRRSPIALLIILLLMAGPTLVPPHAEAATRQCDQRRLPKADTQAVESAARAATQGKLPDLKVDLSCITKTTTSVLLTRPNPTGSSTRREEWRIDCDRERSTWARRGGWTCGDLRLARDMDAKASFLGAESTLFIAFDNTISFETAEALAQRALALFEGPTPPEPCSPAAGLDWHRIRERQLQGEDTSMLVVAIEAERSIVRVRPFGFFTGTGFEFQRDALADPAHAPACWSELIIVD